MYVCDPDALIPHCKFDITASPLFWPIFGVFALIWFVWLFEEGPGFLILKWLCRIALCALMVPLAFLAWYMAAAVPVSVAILLGAGIIAAAVRSSAGRVRRLTAQTQTDPTARAYRNHLHSTDGG